MVRTVMALAIVGLLGCTSVAVSGQYAGADSVGAAETALLMHLIDRRPPGNRVVCLRRHVLSGDSIDSVDSDAQYRELLEPKGYEVVPGSESRLREFYDVMIHAPTDRPAILYQTTFVERSGNQFKFRGAYYEASLAGASCEYTVRRSRGMFRVTETSD